jgi:predicted transcriptional regulator
MMAESGVGALPVVKGGRVVGMITDRDICIALGSKSEAALNTRVDEVMSGELYNCFTDDDLESALKTMRRKRVHRLPVFDRDGELEGILSISDFALGARRLEAKNGLPYKSLLRAYRNMCGLPRSKDKPVLNEGISTNAPQADAPAAKG